MNTIQVKMKFMHPVWDEHEPAYATDHSAGLDLRACIDDEAVEIAPGQKYAFPAGVAIEVLEPSVAGYIFSRSGLGTKDGLTVKPGRGRHRTPTIVAKSRYPCSTPRTRCDESRVGSV